MIIKGKETDYLVIPLAELYDDIDVLKTEIIVRGYDKKDELRIIAESKIEQIEDLISYYEK